MGPFESAGPKRWLAKAALQKYDYLSVRDTLTHRYTEELGVANVDLVPDTAFALQPCSSLRVHEILEAEGIPADVPFVGFNLGIEYMRFCKRNSIDIIDLCARIIRHIRHAYRCNVVLVPHQFLFDEYDYSHVPGYRFDLCDDRYAIECIRRMLGAAEGVYGLKKVYTSSELKGVIGHSEVFVCTRIHPLVAAAAQCVPTAMLHYTHKAKGMMDLLGRGDFVWYARGFDEETVGTTSTATAFDMVDRLWNERVSYRADLQRTVPGLIARTFALGDRVGELMSTHHRLAI
jgi:polysaccharide pyruvyl transferase WcaK-like protein